MDHKRGRRRRGWWLAISGIGLAACSESSEAPLRADAGLSRDGGADLGRDAGRPRDAAVGDDAAPTDATVGRDGGFDDDVVRSCADEPSTVGAACDGAFECPLTSSNPHCSSYWRCERGLLVLIDECDVPPICAPQDARGDGTCERLLGYAWTGGDCVALSGCSCVGADCDALYDEQSACFETYNPCFEGIDCRVTGCADGETCTFCERSDGTGAFLCAADGVEC